MKKLTAMIGACLLVATVAQAETPVPRLLSDCDRDGKTEGAAIEPQRVIVDTDLGSSVDDLFALDFAARMHRAGKLDLMAVMMDRPDRCDPAGEGQFLDFADRYLNTLGFGKDFPLGRSEALSDPTSRPVVINPYWSLVHSNEVASAWFSPSGRDLDAVTNAVALYRRLLNEAPDKSVVICSIGFFNNLRTLMDSTGDASSGLSGKELVALKVKELRIMGGCFDGSVERDRDGKGEYNVEGDIPSATKIFAEWPTPIVVTPWEVGMKLEYKPEDVLADFSVGTLSPAIRAVYARWPNPPEGFVDRQWDPMTVFPLTEGETFAPLSEKGGIAVDAQGRTTFVADPSSNRCYQVASNMVETTVMERFRAVCRTGNPSVMLLESGTPVPGVDYNGSEMVFRFKDIQCGAYEEWDLTFSFSIDGAEYAPESSEWDETLGVLSVRFAIPSDAVTAGNAYDGTLTVAFENDELGSVQLMTASRRLVQGVIEGNVVNANLVRIDGGDEYATVADAVAAAEGATNALASAVFAPSGEVADALDADATRERYAGWFGFDIVSRGETEWSVEAVLTDAAKSNLVENTAVATRQIPVAAIAALAENATTNVTVAGCEPGFYYTLDDGASLADIVPDEDAANRDILCGADGKVEFPSVAKPSDATGFFRVRVCERPDQK